MVVVAVACTTAVEALEADVKAQGVILPKLDIFLRAYRIFMTLQDIRSSRNIGCSLPGRQIVPDLEE